MGDPDTRGAWQPEPRRPSTDPERIRRVSRAQDELVDAGEWELAEQMLASWIAANPDEDTHVARLEHARVLFWRGRVAEAQAALEALRAEDPDDSWSASFLGQVAARAGDYPRARELFEAARARDEHNHEARLFLGGDDLGDALRARRMLTHAVLPPRGCIDFAALCAALDFRRGRRVSLARGELTQAFLDRANLLVDRARVGDDVEVELSLRGELTRAERVVFYTSHALGDTLLGLSALDALFEFFRLHPALARPVEVVSSYAALLQGVADVHPEVTITQLCEPRAPDEALIYAADLTARPEPTLALTTSSPQVAEALFDAAAARTTFAAVVDLHVDRYARDLHAWRTLAPPHRRIDSYPARLHRFLELVLGCKLRDDPASVAVRLPISPEIEGRRELMLQRLGLRGAAYDCVIESASKRSKIFSPELLAGLLCGLARERAALEEASGQRQRIVFSLDAMSDRTFAPELAQLPDEVRARIVTVRENLPGVAALLVGAEAVIAPDTGLAHLAAALGRPTVIVYSAADPWLWRAGSPSVRMLYTQEALAAHQNLTPVNMLEWEAERPLMATAFTAEDVLHAWRAISRR